MFDRTNPELQGCTIDFVIECNMGRYLEGMGWVIRLEEGGIIGVAT